MVNGCEYFCTCSILPTEKRNLHGIKCKMFVYCQERQMNMNMNEGPTVGLAGAEMGQSILQTRKSYDSAGGWRHQSEQELH